MPQIRLTRGGNISQYQPHPPPPKPYDFYLAQLIHYGLDFHFQIEAAQRALEIEIRLGRLRVPSSLVRLEKELKRAHKRAQKKAHEDAVKFAAEQQLGKNTGGDVSAEISENESEDEVTPRSLASKAGKRRKKQQQQQQQMVATENSTVSEEESSDGESSGNGTDQEDDTIVVAPERRESTSSSASTSSSSSSEEVQVVKGSSSIPRVNSRVESESSEDDDEEDDEEKKKGKEKEDSSSDDPFLDRQDTKRIKLEKADKHDESLLTSTRLSAPTINRKQPPPSQVKIRRIASKPRIDTWLNKSVNEKPLNSQSASTTPAPSSTTTTRKPLFDPAKRPSWSIPVRSSPSSPQNDTPKSVTFSQVQRETPSKVPDKEKAGFSYTLKPSQGSPHTPKRDPSFSSDHTQHTPLRSILKKTTANQNPVQTLFATEPTKPDLPTQDSQKTDVATSSRIRRRKRKSGTGGSLDQAPDLDGTRDTSKNASETSAPSDKPFITSNIVNGVPISSQRNVAWVKRPAAAMQNGDGGTGQGSSTDGGDAGSGWGGGFLAVNSSAYQQRQHQGQQAKKAKLSSTNVDGLEGRIPGSARVGEKMKLSLKGGAGGGTTLGLSKDKNKVMLGLGIGQSPGMGSKSRGSLVRAGRFY